MSSSGSSQRRALLAILLLHGNRVVPAHLLVDVLYGERPPRSARHGLQVRISQLRAHLAESLANDAERLVFREPGYRLRVEPGELDWDEFRLATDRGREALARGDYAAAHDLLAGALALWQGAALEDVDAPVLIRHRQRMEQRRLAALDDLADIELLWGRHEDLVERLEELVARHPLRERTRGQLMLALYRCGRSTDALAVYRDGRRILVDHHGLEPGAELRRLEHAILNDDPTLTLRVAGTASGPVTGRKGPSGNRGATGVVPAQLPPDVAGFSGREAQLAELDSRLIDAWLPEPDVTRSQSVAPTALPIMVIAGTAGVGKTALALHWSHRVRDYFPDGQLYVDLSGYAPSPPLRPVDALARWLPALGVPPEDMPVEVEPAAALYRSLTAHRQMLVVLDNARDPEQVRPLLPGGGASRVLVTSRDGMSGLVARDGARPMLLDVLAPAESRHLLCHVLGEERVNAESAAAATLSALCAHLPLALRIAAAQLSGQPQRRLAEQVERLRGGDRLTALSVEGDPRSTVGAAFDLSYRTLPPDGQRMFRLLGLVPGPDLTTAAAAAMAAMSTSDAARVLHRLSAAHLVGQSARDRFTLHDLLREYAVERGRQDDPADRGPALARLLQWYLLMADSAALLLYPEMLRLPLPPPAPGVAASPLAGPGAALEWLAAEWQNLAAGIRHAAEHGPRSAAWLLADTLRGYLWQSQRGVEWLQAAAAGLAAAEAEGDLRAQAALRLNLALANHCVDRYAAAMQHYARAMDDAVRDGWADGRAAALVNLGMVHHDMGNLRQAADRQREALAVFRLTGRRSAEAITLANLGEVLHELGDLREAAEHVAAALALHRELGSSDGERHALLNLGAIAHDTGRYEEASDHLTRALQLSRVLQNRANEVESLRTIASVHQGAGRADEALHFACAALDAVRDVDNRRVEAHALIVLSTVHLDRERPAEAAEHLRHALRLAREAPALGAEIEALVGLAHAHHDLSDLPAARRHAEAALLAARRAGYRILEGRALSVLAAIDLAEGRPADAGRTVYQALLIHRETGHRPGEAAARTLLQRALRDVHALHLENRP